MSWSLGFIPIYWNLKIQKGLILLQVYESPPWLQGIQWHKKKGIYSLQSSWAPPDLHWSPLVPGYGCKYEIRHFLFLTQSTLRILTSVPLFIPFPTPNTSLLTQLQSQNLPKLQSLETFQRHFSSAEPPNYSPLTV